MKLTVNKKEYELKFGLDFINHLDKKFYTEHDGFKIAQGLTHVWAQIELGNPTVLLDLIEAATITGTKPKGADVKNFVETEADLEMLMAEFLSMLENTPLTRFTLKKQGLLGN